MSKWCPHGHWNAGSCFECYPITGDITGPDDKPAAPICVHGNGPECGPCMDAASTYAEEPERPSEMLPVNASVKERIEKFEKPQAEVPTLQSNAVTVTPERRESADYEARRDKAALDDSQGTSNITLAVERFKAGADWMLSELNATRANLVQTRPDGSLEFVDQAEKIERLEREFAEAIAQKKANAAAYANFATARKQVERLTAERNAYAEAMVVALENGIFGDKEGVKRKIEEVLKNVVR